jgi:hypothetical protein
MISRLRRNAMRKNKQLSLIAAKEFRTAVRAVV